MTLSWQFQGFAMLDTLAEGLDHACHETQFGIHCGFLVCTVSMWTHIKACYAPLLMQGIQLQAGHEVQGLVWYMTNGMLEAYLISSSDAQLYDVLYYSRLACFKFAHCIVPYTYKKLWSQMLLHASLTIAALACSFVWCTQQELGSSWAQAGIEQNSDDFSRC